MVSWSRLRWILLLGVIIGAHMAMWMSPETTPESALRLTLANAAIWSVVLLPAVGVTFWLRAHRRIGAERRRNER